MPWTTEPLGDLNLQQRELEEVNTELGFLFPRSQREDHGKITYEGRYRVWKELWLLNYFGRAAVQVANMAEGGANPAGAWEHASSCPA